MVGALLLRGMLAGVIAGILCFAFLRIAGEPQVDRAIAFESQMDAAKEQARIQAGMAPMQKEETFSRHVQAGIGLFTGVAVYSASFGGLFALAYAFVHGRMEHSGPRLASALLAAIGFIAVYVVPSLKYPANPPSVGEADTISMRTALYFGIIVISLIAMILSAMLRRRLIGRFGEWDAFLIAGAVYLIIIAIAYMALPAVDEVPDQFPAIVLWKFRVASMGSQLLMWATIGLAFGALTERAARSAMRHGSRR